MHYHPNPLVERLGWYAIPSLVNLRVGLDPAEGIRNYKDWCYANAVVEMLTHPSLGKMKPDYEEYAGQLLILVRESAHKYGREREKEGATLYPPSRYIEAVMRHYSVDLNAIERETGIDPRTLSGYMSGVEPKPEVMSRLVNAYPVPGARVPYCWVPERIKLKKFKRKKA